MPHCVALLATISGIPLSHFRRQSIAISQLYRAIRQPLLNLYALEDHIVPASACAALGRHVRSRDYAEYAIPTGHIGMYTSRAAQHEIPRRIIDWLHAHR